MECSGNVGEIEGEETNVCWGFTQSGAMDIDVVFVAFCDSTG